MPFHWIQVKKVTHHFAHKGGVIGDSMVQKLKILLSCAKFGWHKDVCLLAVSALLVPPQLAPSQERHSPFCTWRWIYRWLYLPEVEDCVELYKVWLTQGCVFASCVWTVSAPSAGFKSRKSLTVHKGGFVGDSIFHRLKILLSCTKFGWHKDVCLLVVSALFVPPQLV